MIGGYTKRILRIDLTHKKIVEEELCTKELRKFILEINTKNKKRLSENAIQ